jgi:hypothetical protein
MLGSGDVSRFGMLATACPMLEVIMIGGNRVRQPLLLSPLLHLSEGLVNENYSYCQSARHQVRVHASVDRIYVPADLSC